MKIYFQKAKHYRKKNTKMHVLLRLNKEYVYTRNVFRKKNKMKKIAVSINL